MRKHKSASALLDIQKPCMACEMRWLGALICRVKHATTFAALHSVCHNNNVRTAWLLSGKCIRESPGSLSDGMNPPKAWQPVNLRVDMLAEQRMHLQQGWAMCNDESLVRVDLDVLHNSCSEWETKPQIHKTPQAVQAQHSCRDLHTLGLENCSEKLLCSTSRSVFPKLSS